MATKVDQTGPKPTGGARKGAGRPALGDAKLQRFMIRISKEERAKVEAGAAKAGQTASAFAREMLMMAIDWLKKKST